MRQKFIRFLRANWLIYLTLGCAFLVGVSLGAISIQWLGESATTGLSDFLGQLFQGQPEKIDLEFSQYLLRENLIMMLIIWVLGLTVVGVPLIYLINIYEGVGLGFSVCFVVMFHGWAGFGFVMLGILLPSILFFACLLLGSGLATQFSFHLLRSIRSGKPVRGQFSQYSLLFLLTTLGLVASSFLQAFCSSLSVSFFGLS